MYESPINQILGEMQITCENECMKAVQSVGFDVNKEELLKALKYDRNQYEKGYKIGYQKALLDFAEKLTQSVKENYFFAGEFKEWTLRAIEEDAEQLKNENNVETTN